MRLRKFSARTPREALASVKATLGPEAVILATRPLADGGVEITAAVDLDQVTAGAPSAPTPELGTIGRDLGLLAARVARIDRALAPGRGTAHGLDEEAQSIAERLALNGVAPALAEAVAEDFMRGRHRGLQPAAALAASVERHLAIAGTAQGAPATRVTALVGPTGGGKTTTIAKLAAHALAGGASVGLVMADTQRIAAAEQLGTYARLLDVPMRVAGDGEALVSAIADLSGHDVIYVDTAGLDGDAQGARALAKLLRAVGGVVTTTAVVSAGASDGALRAAWRQLGDLAPRACVVTKVDEGGGLGTACGWLTEVGMPLAWLGTGTRVPDDLAAANGRAVAAWLTAA